MEGGGNEGTDLSAYNDLLYGSEEQQLNTLSNLSQHPELISTNIADYWSVLQSLSTNELMSVRSSALVCAAQLLPLCETESFCQIFAAQSLATLTTLLKNIGGTADAGASLPHLGNAKVVFSFFTTSLALVPEGWRAELSPLKSLFKYIFDALILVLNNTTKIGKWVPTLVKAGVPKEMIAGLHNANNGLYGDVLILIPQITKFLCLAPLALPNVDTIAFACSRLLPVRDIKGDSRLTGVIWNALRELFETFSPVLQDRQVELVEPLVLSLLRMMGNLLTELVQAAPRGQEEDTPSPTDQKSFDTKLKTIRFFFRIINFFAREYPYAFCLKHLDSVASFVVRTYSCLQSSTPLAAKAQALIRKHVSAEGAMLVMGLVGSSIPLRSKMFLLEQFYIDTPNDPLAISKLHILLVLMQQIPSESVFAGMSRILYSIVEGLIQCSSQNTEDKATGTISQAVSYSGAVLATAGFIYHLASRGALEDAEVFLIEHLFHPHYLASLFAVQLWHFLLSNADDAIRSRHSALIAEMIEKGKHKMRVRLARFLPFILPSLSLTNTEILFNSAMKSFVGIQDLSATPQASTLRVAAPFLSILPLAKLMEQSKTAKQAVQNLIGSCMKACQSLYTPPKTQYWAVECLRGIYSHTDLWENYDLQASQITAILGDCLDRTTRGEMANKNALLQSLIKFSSVLIPILPPPHTVALYLKGFKSLATAFPVTKLAIIEFVHKCALLEFDPDTQKDILESCSALIQLFIEDKDWIVCAEVIKLVRYYMMFGGVEVKDAPKMIGARNRELITLYLQGQPSFPPTDKPYMTPGEALNMWNKKLQESIEKMRKDIAVQSYGIGNQSGWRMGEASRLQKLLKLTKMANEIAATIPSASLTHSGLVSPIQQELQTLTNRLGIQFTIQAPSPTTKITADTQDLPSSTATATIELNSQEDD